MVAAQVFPVVMDVELPAGTAGPDPMRFDVRCFAISHDDGVTLVDTGLQADARPVTEALADIGADWGDVSDVILTHDHPDHCGGLAAIASKAPSAVTWGGERDSFPVAASHAEDGTLVHGLRVVATPGHTPGHICLLDEDHGILLTGDAICSQAGQMTQGPEAFIADRERSIQSLRRLLDLRPERMLFGHGQEVLNPTECLATFLTA